MDNQGNQKQSCRSSSRENSTHSQSRDHQEVSSDEGVTRLIEGDTYPISDSESTIDSVYIIDTNTVKLARDDEELNQSMSQDSLIDGEHDDQNRHHPNSNNKNERPSSTNTRMSSKMSTMKSSSNGIRSLALDEHIKLVKQKKEEAEVLRLQRFQEQLRKKEQKWQQQQLERVKKWLQLRNRDTDHRSQVEIRRKKREEEAKAKIDELIRREKEREQNYHHRVTHHLRTNPSQKPDSLMSMSTDILSTRRAISASRLRSNPPDHPHRRGLNQSPASATSDALPARDDTGNSVAAETSNGDAQIRTQSVNRPNLQETIRRLAKPRPNPMTQSIQIGAATSTSHGLPVSRSSYQLRVPTPPVNSPPTTTASNLRRHLPSRPATVPTSANESRTSPSDESARSDHHAPSLRQASANITRSKVASTTSKPPTSSTRSKSSAPRSIMTTSHSSSSLSAAAHKSNVRRIPPAKPKPITSIATPESQPISDDQQHQQLEQEQQLPVNENTPVEQEVVPEIPDTTTPVAMTSKREQQMLDEQDYQRKLNQKIREAQQRLEIERQREEERQRQLELEEYEREQEQIRLVEQQTRAEQERLQRAIEERDRENESKRQEEQRLQQQREDIERRQAEEAERLQRERQERAKKEDEERNARKKRLDLIMRRTRQISPNSKQENNSNTTMADQTNGHDQTSTPDPTYSPAGTMKSSMSENHFPSSSSTDNFLLHHEPVLSPITATPIDTSKFKSPLIQSLLNKARNTRSTDNLTQSSMTASQIMTESMIDESTIGSATRAGLSDDDDDDERIASSINGHADLHLSSSNNMNSYHDRPMETAAAFQ